MRTLPLTLFLCLAAIPALAAGQPSPEQLGELFCKASLSDDMGLVENDLTPFLTLAIAEAEAKNTQIQAKAPDEKPPLGDGLPWRSWPDFADGCAIGTTYRTADRVFADINYSFSESPDANYTDQLVLMPSVEDQNLWQIDDVIFATGMTMRSSLASAFGP
ncbi:hypothetical protein [Devosia sp.]|uniref:hypothetical protein n=1 Tax=Devosia sp. TaxID=1871048 RepID=UPI001B2BDAA7|nr:hypothetical protein [Devosia sp.]MBO9587355.1 hypothetical protein [Devosia sp.]